MNNSKGSTSKSIIKEFLDAKQVSNIKFDFLTSYVMPNLYSHPVFNGGKIPNPTIIVSTNPATSQHWRSFGQGGCSVGTLRPAPRRVHTRPNSHGVSHAAAIVYPERENPGMIVSEGVAFVKRLILIWIFFSVRLPSIWDPFLYEL